MRTITIELGGHEYEIHELTTRKAEAWRREASEPLEGVLGLIRSNKELTGDTIAEAVGVAGDLLLGSVSTIKELLFAYSPELQLHRDEIEDNAYDSEIVTAFVELLKLAFPFGSLLQTFKGLMQQNASSKKAGSPKRQTFPS